MMDVSINIRSGFDRLEQDGLKPSRKKLTKINVKLSISNFKMGRGPWPISSSCEKDLGSVYTYYEPTEDM